MQMSVYHQYLVNMSNQLNCSQLMFAGRELSALAVIGSIEGSKPVSIISNQIIAVLRTHNFSVPGTEISSGMIHQSMYMHSCNVLLILNLAILKCLV